MKLSSSSSSSGAGGGGLVSQQSHEGDKKCLNSELWHACAGPLVSLPTMGSRVVYFPQGHSEQVSATTNREIDGQIPNYPSLPPQLICQLHNVTMHADVETDEVYAQMTLHPMQQEQKDMIMPLELGFPNKQPTNYFCKTLTASDTSTHGGFSVPRRAAEKVFPPLDFSQQPPVQELVARDLHDVEWKFRHIFRGQPKRHLLTTGWSVFVSAKRLVAGDSILFIWNEKNQLLLGIRRAVRPQTVMPSSVLSSDSMHIGLLAAAAHAAATNSCFTVFYNPRASPSEFVIPLSKYVKAVFHTRVSVGMRFRMLFETEESSVRRYMGTITGIADLDSVRWPNSHWRSVKVGWDESTASERQPRVSLWEIEPLTTFPMYPSLFPLRLKRPWHQGVSSMLDGRGEAGNGSMWLRSDGGMQGLHSPNFQPVGMLPWMQQGPDPTIFSNEQNNQYHAMMSAGMQSIGSGDLLKQQAMQMQQSPQSLNQAGSYNPLQQQQSFQQSLPQQMSHAQTQLLPEYYVRHLLQQQPDNRQQGQQQQMYQDGFQIHNGQLQQRQQPDGVSPSYPKNPEHSMLNDSLSHQVWEPRFAHSEANVHSNSLPNPPNSEKISDVNPEDYSLVAQNHTLFGVNVDPNELVLPSTMPSFGSSGDADISTTPLGASVFNNSMYSMQDSSDLLHSTGQMTSPVTSETFVKVYKSGSVGRSLDITRFSSYHELREALGHMFEIEGSIDDPLRSGWQLVFVDREDEVLLLGDDPWEVFVNNVWYIKILSPEDVQKMGNRRIESSYNDNVGDGGGMNNTNNNYAQDLVSKLPSLGSLPSPPSLGSLPYGDGNHQRWTTRG